MLNNQNQTNEQLTETALPTAVNNNLGGDFPQVFYDLFKGRTDVIALAGSYATKVNSEEEILSYVKKHLDGVRRLGIYNQFSDSTSPWAMVEFENHGKNRPEDLDNPAQSSIEFVNYLKSAGITAYRELSKNPNGNSYHVWLFFDKNLVSAKIRSALNSVLSNALGIETEVFPKADKVPVVGNFVWLPLFGGHNADGLGVNEGHTVFIDENGNPFPDQHEFIRNIPKIREEDFDAFVEKVNSINKLTKQETKDPVIESSEEREAWDDSLKVRLSDGTETTAISLHVKTAIYCPFHDDQKPSAFIVYSKTKKNAFIYCSSCRKTFWKTKTIDGLKDLCRDYWSYGKDLLEIGIVGGHFYMEKNSREKVLVRTGAVTKEENDIVLAHLFKEKHIPHLNRVNYLGEVQVEQSYYSVSGIDGMIDVHYSALPAKLQDNEFIERYLNSTFGDYSTFIKEYMAVYCYTNHTDLPTLVFKGGRNRGKNTFAEMLGEIYKPISQMWKAEEGNFNPEVEMKLLIADETVSDDPDQYKTLKKYSGAKYFTVNHKYVRPYEVLNNMNIVILSNANTPIFVDREEVPTDDRNNQFFVYTFKPLSGAIDKDLEKKLTDRLGHYLRTELKAVFDSLNMDGYRYSIKTPITEDEKALFANNVTEVDAEADRFMERMVDISEGLYLPEYKGFIDGHYVPTEIFNVYSLPRGISKNKIIRNLVDRGYIVSNVSDKIAISGRRLRTYKMTDKTIKKLEAEVKKDKGKGKKKK